MIEGRCRTNLDGYERCKWPEVFVAVPRIGERVEAKDGKRLKVCGVTHLMQAERGDPSGPQFPMIEVELTKRV
tara:strand:+ start:1279 stop:1497 length:219 start_codon:yes stop_codon:yes gene_type:complete